MGNNFNGQKLKITYPCHWTYKVIGSDEEKLREGIKNTVHLYEYKVEYSNQSRTGKYCSLNLVVKVPNEEIRLKIHQEFKNHCDVQMVL